MRENQQLFETTDWSATPLGPVEGWSPQMRAVINTMLASGFPISTGWGPTSIQIYNDAYNHIYGDKHPAAFGQPASVMWPEIWEFLGPAIEHVQLTREPLTFHDTLLPLARHGLPEECWFDFSYSEVTAADGQPLGMMSVAVEITRDVVLARRHATCDVPMDAMADGSLEALAQVLEERLRTNPMDAAAAVMLAVDPASGVPSDALFQIGDWAGLEAWARKIRPLTHALMQQDLEDPERPEEVGSRATLVTLLDDSRQPIALLALASNALVVPDGHRDFVISLSARLQSVLAHADTLDTYRRRIAEQDMLYRFLFDNILDAVVYARTDGGADASETILTANQGAARLFGYPLDELRGMQRDQLQFPNDATFQAALDYRERERFFTGELTFRRKDGSPVSAELSSRLVVSPDGSTHSVNMLRDVSARANEAAERARQARFEAIAQLTAGMAHDFNNLLTVVQGSLELVLDDLPEGARAREYAENAMLCAERGAELTGQLLSYSRQQVLHLQAVDLNLRVMEIVPLVKATLGERIKLELALDPHLPPCYTDLAQLTTALLNLAANARDAMPTGGILRIETELDLVAPQFIVLRVCDNGPGIPVNLLDRIFEPYLTTKTLGAGLGLAMIQGFVHQSGGRLQASNVSEGGACFELRLLVALAGMGETENDAPIPFEDGGGRHVLLVDDHPLIREQTREILVRAGFRVSVAANADEALASLQADAPDLLLTDVDMPGERNGIALANVARAHDSALPILVMTGHDPLSNSGFSQHDRIDALAKPFDRAALLQAIASLLTASR